MESRFFKAALAVLICCSIYELCNIGTGIPFYAGIAAIICMQSGIRSSFQVGINRIIGTFIGGFTGMAIQFLTQYFNLLHFPYIRYILISACIFPLMLLAERLRSLNPPRSWYRRNSFLGAYIVFDFMRKSALTNITCIAFLSVTITHGGELSTTHFAFCRILDTFIGVFVSFLVNLLPNNDQSHPLTSSTNSNSHQDETE